MRSRALAVAGLVALSPLVLAADGAAPATGGDLTWPAALVLAVGIIADALKSGVVIEHRIKQA